jgi:acyl phosphate:glycerol-3-phosphate acyltransferase
MKWLILVVAYLLGSIPFGFLIGKRRGIDIRQYGSGNIGTSNVGRVLGKKAAILTLLGDGLKGVGAVLLAGLVIGEYSWSAAAGLAAIIGHNWPVYLRFKGGKGVTTTYGAFLALSWLPGLATILTWVLVTWKTNKSSVAALVSAPCAVLFAGVFQIPQAGLGFAALTAGLIYLRHIDNIKRMLAGTETRLDDKIDISDDQQP